MIARECQNKTRIKGLTNQNHTQVEEVNQLGEKLLIQKQNVLSLKDALSLEILEKERYMKSIQAQAKFSSANFIKGKTVEYHDTVVRVIFVDSSDDKSTVDSNTYIKVPFDVEYKDSWNYFRGNIGKTSFTIDSLVSKNELRITLGYKKQGLFKKAKPILEGKSSNPNANIQIEKNVTIKEPKPFYKRTWFGIIIGVGTTLLLL